MKRAWQFFCYHHRKYGFCQHFCQPAYLNENVSEFISHSRADAKANAEESKCRRLSKPESAICSQLLGVVSVCPEYQFYPKLQFAVFPACANQIFCWFVLCNQLLILHESFNSFSALGNRSFTARTPPAKVLRRSG